MFQTILWLIGMCASNYNTGQNTRSAIKIRAKFVWKGKTLWAGFMEEDKSDEGLELWWDFWSNSSDHMLEARNWGNEKQRQEWLHVFRLCKPFNAILRILLYT